MSLPITERIDKELLEETLRKGGWTFNAVDYILEAVRSYEDKVDTIDKIATQLIAIEQELGRLVELVK